VVGLEGDELVRVVPLRGLAIRDGGGWLHATDTNAQLSSYTTLLGVAPLANIETPTLVTTDRTSATPSTLRLAKFARLGRSFIYQR
jgi:hypothetical protein